MRIDSMAIGQMLESGWVSYIFKTILAIILSGAIGIERQAKNRPAGFRTHILVCIGAMTIMILSEEMYAKYYYTYNATFDPTRMSAQVVSGIGFLGAGTIMHFGNNVKGLTTAASLWTVAAIGMTIGAGFYPLAIIITASIYVTLMIFKKISQSVNNSRNIEEIIVHVINKPKALGEIQLLLGNSGAKILDLEFLDPSDAEAGEATRRVIEVRIIIKIPYRMDLPALLSKLETLNGVAAIERV